MPQEIMQGISCGQHLPILWVCVMFRKIHRESRSSHFSIFAASPLLSRIFRGGVERYYSLPERIYREYAQRQDSINSEF